MSKIFQPSNQIKLTNVSIVRLKKGGKRFEIACYKNKVAEWRTQVEKDLDNVLQIPSVFINVSKGQVANRTDLVKSFKTDNVDEIIQEILSKGEVQVNEKERAQQMDNVHRDIAMIVAEKCVDPRSKRPYTVSMIEKALSDAHFNAHPTKSAKQQALEAIRQLKEKGDLPIARAQMRLRITLGLKDAKRVKEKIAPCIASVEEEDFGEEYEMICLIDPGQFRTINDTLDKEAKGKAKLETLSLSETMEGDEHVE
jgi:ribosome maturation protein SDO1